MPLLPARLLHRSVMRPTVRQTETFYVRLRPLEIGVRQDSGAQPRGAFTQALCPGPVWRGRRHRTIVAAATASIKAIVTAASFPIASHFDAISIRK
jgi:hypothetical protein